MQSNWEFPAQRRTVVLIAADLKWRELAQKTPECRDRQHGWQSWIANGFTQVQINIPPKAAAQTDLFAISCEYPPDVVRRIGWTPPKEVLEQLKP